LKSTLRKLLNLSLLSDNLSEANLKPSFLLSPPLSRLTCRFKVILHGKSEAWFDNSDERSGGGGELFHTTTQLGYNCTTPVDQEITSLFQVVLSKCTK
jgi:hypothetical protein